MKVLIVGASGQLGRALVGSVPEQIELVAWDRSQLDLSQTTAIAAAVQSVRPAVLINASAYTAVDLAESQPDQAHAVNAEGVGALAVACAALGTRLVHVSTDFVFDGTLRPSVSTDRCHCAAQRLRRQQARRRKARSRLTSNLNWCVLRTAWVYASTGKNFMLTMLRLFNEKPVVRVVADQVGTPTSADFAGSLRLACGDSATRKAFCISPMRASPAGTTSPWQSTRRRGRLAS